MKAILWDGNKQIIGILKLKKNLLQFELEDFTNTNLNFSLPYLNVKKIRFQTIYQTSELCVKIVTHKGSVNVFVVEQPQKLKKLMDLKIKK